jgi:predicted lysophospholipase L1 biosynthesis ABC-type transport system permease subunit
MGAAFSFVVEHFRALLWATLGFYALLLLTLPLVGKVPISYSVRNLLVRWKITLMTMTAFTLIAALVVVMLAFINGMYRLTANSAHPGNVMVLSDGAPDEAFSNLNQSEVANLANLPAVLKEDGQPLASWEVYVVVNMQIKDPAPGRRPRRFVQVRGLDDPVISGKVHTLDLYPGGEWFGPVGVAEQDGTNYHQAVLGEGIAREMGKDVGKPTLAVGDTFELADWQWVVTGVMKSGGSTFDSEIWAKRELIKDKFHKSNYTTCVLRTENADTAVALRDFIPEQFTDTKVNAQTESDYYEKLNGTNRVFLIGTLVVTGVMAFGGIFGVMNTMFAAISQRTKDIGVLRIIGFTGRSVLLSFFLEAMFLATVGGLLGCALGCVSHGWTATSIAGSGGGGGKTVVLRIAVDGTILATGMVFSLVMGTLGGLIPSLFAMRVRPLESLR